MNGQAATRPGARRRSWLIPVGIAALALALRLGAVATVHVGGFARIAGRPAHRWAGSFFFPDSAEFLGAALNIRAGRGPMVSETSRIGRMPGYPVFLAFVGAVFGDSLLAYRLADAVVSAAVVVLVGWLGQVVFSRREGVVAALGAALYPAFVLYVVTILSETLFMAFLVGGSACLAVAMTRRGLKWPALAGLVLGLAVMVRASHLLCVPLLAVLWVVVRRFEKATLAKAGVMLAAFAATLVPWTARNWRASGGHLVVTTLRTGPSLYEGLNPQATGAPMMDAINWDAGTKGMSEWEKNRYWLRKALEFARANPGRVARLALAKLVRFWSLVPNLAQLRQPLFAFGLGAPYVVVILLAVVGLATSWRRADVGLILVLPVVYHSALHTVFVGSIRYRIAVMPLVMVLAARGAVAAWSRWAARLGHAKR